MTSSERVVHQLRELHDDYTERVNSVIEEDRDDLAMTLSDSYVDEALRVITDADEAPTR